MYKNQLQELAQRSCFNLPSYSCIREGPDHAPRFKATVNFNGETFESPGFCTTLRQAEHAAAEVALHALSKHGPSRSLAAKVLDETGVYKNLLQETTHRAGLNLPVYTTVRSGPGHTPVFTCTVELAGMSFAGEPAKTKKQAQKNAAMAAWSALKQLPNLGTCSSSSSSQPETERNEEQEQIIVARALAKLHPAEGSKPSQQNDRQSGRRKQVPVWREANPGNSAPFYSLMPCQSWVHSNFFPEMPMYQTWHQENTPSQQRHFLALTSPTPNDPRHSPYMQPLMQNPQGQYFPVIEQNLLGTMPSYGETPPMYFPVYPSGPSVATSQLSIQEIHDEKSGPGEKWFPSSISDSNGDSSIRSNDVLSSTQDHKLETSDPPIPNPTDHSSEYKASESYDKQIPSRHGNSEISLKGGKTTYDSAFQQGTDATYTAMVSDPSSSINVNRTPNQVKRDRREWMNGEQSRGHSSPSHLGFLTSTAGIYDSVQSANMVLHPDNSPLGLLQGFQPLHGGVSLKARMPIPVVRTGIRSGNFRSRDLSMAPPVTIRNAIPVFSARPGGDVSYPPGLSSNVPSVNIRTVQPVCSAPAGRTAGSIQRRMQEPEVISKTASEFGKLQI